MQKTHKKLAIIGAGGHGKVVAATALSAARWTEIVFLDDEAEGEILGLPVIGCTGLAGMSVYPPNTIWPWPSAATPSAKKCSRFKINLKSG